MRKRKVVALSVAFVITLITGCSHHNELASDTEVKISVAGIEGETKDTKRIVDLNSELSAHNERIDDYLKNTRPYGLFVKNDIIGLLIEDYDANFIVLTDFEGSVINKIEIPFRRSVYYENIEVYDEGIVLHGENNDICFFDISTTELTEIEIPDSIASKMDIHNQFTYLPKKKAIAYASEDGALYLYKNEQEHLLYQGDISNPNSFIPCEVKGAYDQNRLMICGYINDTDSKTGYCYECIGLYDLETDEMEWKKSNNERMISTANADIFCLSSGGSLIQGNEIGNVYTILPTGELTVKMDIASAENIVDYIPAHKSFLCVKRFERGSVYMIDKEGKIENIDIGYDCPDLAAVNEEGSAIVVTAIIADDKKEGFASILYVGKLGGKDE